MWIKTMHGNAVDAGKSYQILKEETVNSLWQINIYVKHEAFTLLECNDESSADTFLDELIERLNGGGFFE